MKTLLRPLLRLALPALVAAPLASCYYDPYGYNPGGYPAGPVFGAGAVTGAVLVATASSDWGYDPYRYCYYNYSRRAYYDPWLSGYYPVGYCPPPVAGCPHPYGWRPGYGVCPPPRGINDRWIDRYNDRLAAIQASNYAWASKVRYNRQTQQQHMQQNTAVWANQVRANRQNAIQIQRERNEAIRQAQQSWADRVRANRGVNRAQPGYSAQPAAPVAPPTQYQNTYPGTTPPALQNPPGRGRRPGQGNAYPRETPPESTGQGPAVGSPLFTPVQTPSPALGEPVLRGNDTPTAIGRGRAAGGATSPYLGRVRKQMPATQISPAGGMPAATPPPLPPGRDNRPAGRFGKPARGTRGSLDTSSTDGS